MKKLKVLLSAYACEPDKVSEQGVGWHWARQIARFHEVWVVTRANNKESIDAEMQIRPDPNMHFVYYDVPKWLSFWKKKERGLYLYYALWQAGAYRVAKAAHERERFDLVHHITFGNIWLPTFMQLLNIPFVWGPVGGADKIPRPFRKEYPIKAKLQEYIRDMMIFVMHMNPFFRSACKNARLIIARTEETLNRIPLPYRAKTLKMIETGVPSDYASVRKETSRECGLRVLSVGRLIHLKGFDLTIRSFASAFRESKAVSLTIVGHGPDKERLQRICEEEGITDRVTFTGWLRNNKVLELMAQSDIFIFPSLKEGGPWVLFEAMLSGLPVICLDIAGPADIVDGASGIKIRPVTPAQTISELSDALERLSYDAALRERMGKAAAVRIRESFSWDTKGNFIQALYERFLGGR